MTDDREYYSRACRIVRLCRYIVLVVLAVFIILSLMVFDDEITFDNFRYLMKYIEISPPVVSEDNSAINYSASSNASYGIIKEKLMVINQESIASYDLNGRRMLNEEIALKNPICVENEKYVLIYDLDGFVISVYNSFSKVFETRLETPIEYVYLSEDGGFAVITREKTYAGGFVVYDSKFRRVYSFMTRNANVTDVCYNGEKGIVACATTDVRDGDFVSEIMTFDINDDENYKSKTEIFGQLPLGMLCNSKGFSLITDMGIHFYDFECRLIANTSFDYNTLCAFFGFKDFFAVTHKSVLAGSDTGVRIYSYDGRLLFSEEYASEITDIDTKNGKLYVLLQFELRIYDCDEAYNFIADKSQSVSHDGEYKKVFALENNEYLLITRTGAKRCDVREVSNDE